MKKEYCFDCNKKIIPKEEIQENKYKINGESFYVKEHIYKCPYCNNEVLPDDYDPVKNIYDEYLKLYDLTFEDFKNIRGNFNLSHDMFAKLLGWGKKTIIRYEKQESFPQKQYIEVYAKLKKGKTYFLNILRENKKRLGDDYYEILKKSGLYNHVKTINSFIYMLKDNIMYKTALIKNMFALDFYYNKLYGMPITTLKYAKADHGPIIDNHENIINYLSDNNYVKITVDMDDKALFKTDLCFDENLFSKEELDSMEYVKNKLKGKTATELSNWSHEFLGWKETTKGNIISLSKYKDDFNIDTI